MCKKVESGISSIDVTEAATGGVLLKKVFLKISQSSQEQLCQSLFLNKIEG